MKIGVAVSHKKCHVGIADWQSRAGRVGGHRVPTRTARAAGHRCERGARSARAGLRFHCSAARHGGCFASTGPSGRGQEMESAMRYYTMLPLLLAPLAGACTPETMAAPEPNETTPTSTAGSSSQLPVRQIEQIVGAQ